MATETSTIRVSRATRDLLAEQARERGLPLAALLGEIAEAWRREAIWRSEHEANRIDEQNSDARTEPRPVVLNSLLGSLRTFAQNAIAAAGAGAGTMGLTEVLAHGGFRTMAIPLRDTAQAEDNQSES
jgi:hypothetical protein